jgi:hypothetical protein
MKKKLVNSTSYFQPATVREKSRKRWSVTSDWSVAPNLAHILASNFIPFLFDTKAKAFAIFEVEKKESSKRRLQGFVNEAVSLK